MSNSLPPHGLQHTRLPCPSLSPRVCLNLCPLSQWCRPTISSSVAPCFSSIFPRIRIFSNELALCIRWPKYWRFSFSISYSNNIQGWFPLELTGLISLLSKSLLQQFKAQFKSINSSMFSLLYGANFTSILDYWKKQLWLYGPLLAKWCLCFLIHCLDLS